MSTSFEKFRKLAKSTSFIYKQLFPLVALLRRVRSKRNLRYFRHYCLKLSKELSERVFVKVGANDGITGDPCSDILLGNTNCRGLLIEPVPYVFDRLRANFKDSRRFRLEQ